MTVEAPSPEAQVPEAPKSESLYGGFGIGVLVIAVTGLRLLYLTLSPFDLHPDEAQYWSWSLEPAWGYFSKPPMIAWVIAVATALCGEGEACIKAASPIAHGITACFVYATAACLYDRRAAFLAALLFLTLPGVSFSATIMSTDPLLLTCWAAALYIAVRLWYGEAYTLSWWMALGLALGLGLNAKYAMAYFLIGLVLWLLMVGEARRSLLGHGRGWLGLLIALTVAGLLILPNIHWNYEHGFVTFAHTAANADISGIELHPRKAVEFLASQLGVFGPLSFAILLGLLIWPPGWFADPPARFLVAFTLASLLPIIAVSFLSRAHANWAATAYVAASIWISGILMSPAAGAFGRFLLKFSILLHIAVAGAALGGTIGQTAPGLYWGKPLPARFEPFKYYTGWKALGDKITELQTAHPGLPLLSSDRMMVASALYYVEPKPVIIQAWHPTPEITNHFRLKRPWKGPTGASALLLSRRGDPAPVLARFDSHELLATLTVPVATGETRTVRVFHVKGFLGYKRAQR